MTGRYCVIGQSLSHTLSPNIHALFGCGEYRAVELKDLAELKSFVLSHSYRGYNVTIPYKRDIMPFLDEVSEAAKKIGAVNTVYELNGKLYGDNTDADGLLYGLRRAGIELAGKEALILGSGGTARAARYVCMREGAADIKIVSRTGKINYTNCYDVADPHVIINATPVGMTPNAYACPIEIEKFARVDGVFDCIYNPLRTLLTLRANAAGINAENGLSMLVEQARLSHNIFARASGGDEVGESETERVRLKLAHERRNIVLIGMSGSGKTSIGRRVAKMLGRKFYDTDAIVEDRTGKSVEEIFAREGEQAFRKYEEEAIENCCKQLGAVIATGGGAVLSAKNRFFIKANGLTAFIFRDVGSLALDGRPLARDIESAKALFEKRKALYEALADIKIINDGDIEVAAAKICEESEK